MSNSLSVFQSIEKSILEIHQNYNLVSLVSVNSSLLSPLDSAQKRFW